MASKNIYKKKISYFNCQSSAVVSIHYLMVIQKFLCSFDHVILCPCAPLFLCIMCSSAPVLMCSFAIMSSLAPLIMWTFATFHHELLHSCGPLLAQGQDPISWLLKFPSNCPIADDLGPTGILMFTQHQRAKWWGEGNYLLLGPDVSCPMHSCFNITEKGKW